MNRKEGAQQMDGDESWEEALFLVETKDGCLVSMTMEQIRQNRDKLVMRDPSAAKDAPGTRQGIDKGEPEM